MEKIKEKVNEYYKSSEGGQVINELDEFPLKSIRFFRLTKEKKIKWYYGDHFSKGRVFFKWEKNGLLKIDLLASPTERHAWGWGRYFERFLQQMEKEGILKEITMKEVMKLAPHWNKAFHRVLMDSNFLKS